MCKPKTESEPDVDYSVPVSSITISSGECGARPKEAAYICNLIVPNNNSISLDNNINI
jgi:hypothetical protein